MDDINNLLKDLWTNNRWQYTSDTIRDFFMRTGISLIWMMALLISPHCFLLKPHLLSIFSFHSQKPLIPHMHPITQLHQYQLLLRCRSLHHSTQLPHHSLHPLLNTKLYQSLTKHCPPAVSSHDSSDTDSTPNSTS